MAWTQTDIDRLKSAIASGTKTVSYADKTVTYQDLDSMLQALALIEAEVNGASASATATASGRATFASFSRD